MLKRTKHIPMLESQAFALAFAAYKGLKRTKHYFFAQMLNPMLESHAFALAFAAGIFAGVLYGNERDLG